LSNAVLKGVSWDSANTLAVKDGKVLTLSKMPDGTKIKNNGNLYLGDTGAVQFANSMAEDLQKKLEIKLVPSAGNKISISTNYGRNTALADEFEESFVNGVWKDLGTGETNLEYKIEVIRNPRNIRDIKIHFDGNNTITLTPYKTDTNSSEYRLFIRDKYIKDKDNKEIVETTINGTI